MAIREGILRIVLVSPYDFATPGGVTEHVTQLDQGLRELGHQTAIVAPVSRQKYFRPPANLYPVGRVIDVPTNGSVARISLSIELSRAIKVILRELSPDVVHLHEPFMPLVPLAALRHSSSANVATFHAYSGNELGYRHARPLLGHFAAKLHGRIAVSITARLYVSRHFPGDYAVVPNGVNLQQFLVNEAVTRDSRSKLTILFVGRLDERKGFEYLFQAYRDLVRRRHDLRLVVVGAYSPRRAAVFQSILRREGIDDVLFAGYASPTELVHHYLAADVVCAPSLGGESFGTVLLEAMAAGKPIVASRIPGYDEVVDDGQEGILVPPANAEALAAVLDQVLRDRDGREEMGARGRVKAARFAWPVVAERVVRYYEETLARKGGTPITMSIGRISG